MKKITVALAAMLLAAFTVSAAMAADIYSMNASRDYTVSNSVWTIGGFALQNDTAHDAAGIETQTWAITGNLNMTTTAGSIYSPFNRTASMNVYAKNNSGGQMVLASRSKTTGANITVDWLEGTTVSQRKGMNGFYTMSRGNLSGGRESRSPYNRTNPASAIWYSMDRKNTLIHGVGNRTFNGTHGYRYNGTVLLTGIIGTPSDALRTTFANGDTWTFYSLMTNGTNATARVGTFKYGTTSGAKNATVSFYDVIGGGSIQNYPFRMNRTGGGNLWDLTNATCYIFRNATMDNSTNIIVSSFYVDANTDTSSTPLNGKKTVTTIAIKGGAELTDSTLAQAWRLSSAGVIMKRGANSAVGIPADLAGLALGTPVFMRRGSFVVDSNLNLNGYLVSNYGSMGSAAIVQQWSRTLQSQGAKIGRSTYTKAGVSHSLLAFANVTSSNYKSNMTNVIGTYNSNLGLFVGIDLGNLTVAKKPAGMGLVIMTTASASFGNVTSAGLTTNATGAALASLQIVQNRTRGVAEYGWDKLAAEFTAMATNYTPLGSGWKAFNASINTAAVGYTYPSIISFGFSLNGTGVKAEDVNLLKLYDLSTGNQNGNLTRWFSRTTTPNTPTDGNWWLSDGKGSTNVITAGELNPVGTYWVNYYIKDNGNYDINKARGRFADPAMPLVQLSTPGTSSSSTGCVFNPTAGFGLEWLLLLLAPAIGIIRNRFRK